MNNNLLEFFVKMKDLMSSPLNKLASTTKKNMKDMGSSIDTVVAKNKELAKSFDDVERRASSSGSSLLGWGKKLGIAAAAGAIMAGAGAFAKSSAQSYINYERNAKSFEVLAGNKGIGQTLAGELNTLQQKTILGPEVFRNAQTMMGFGVGAEKVIPYINMLGEVSMGNAERMQSLTLAFSQVQAAGKLTGQDLLQFVNAGFNPLNQISKDTGVSMGDLKKKMEEGAISADMVVKAFKSATGEGGLFNGMLNQMAETTGGKIAQLEGSFEALKIAMGERMKGPLNSTIGGLAKLVDWTRKMVEIPIEQKLQDQITKIRALQTELTASNTTHQRQLELLRELEQINPNITRGIDAQNIEYGKLAANIDKVTGALRNKIFLEKFDKQNADTLTSYAEASQKRDTGFADAMAVVGMFPDIAGNTSMTLGQKQMAAQKRLKDAIASGKDTKYSMTVGGSGMGYGSQTMQGSREGDALGRLRRAISQSNEADALMAKLNPDIAKINKTKAVLGGQIDKYLGVGSMTAAQIKGNGTGSATSGTTNTGRDIAQGITGGGPRVININGVKFTDKVEVHAATMSEGIDQLERRLEEMYLRVLNSGASIGD